MGPVPLCKDSKRGWLAECMGFSILKETQEGLQSTWLCCVQEEGLACTGPGPHT